jgi:carboxyvinyl-carboxyphosphonate phosphorylmutase
VHPGSVFDPISARIAEDLGFEVGMFAGSIASFTVLGAPDIIVLTLSEFADQAHRICRAGNLPLLCDADHGYGNALNVMRTVEELETAGVAALSIEDTALPQPFGSQGKAQLLSVDEGVGKMRAALEARRDSGLVICGRTSAASMTGVADAIVRAKAYAAAGVDAIFLVGVKTRADLDAIAAEIKLPPDSRRCGQRAHRLAVSGPARRARLPAGASTVHGGGAGGVRHAACAARGYAGRQASRRRTRGAHEARDTRRRLLALDA